MLTDTLDNTTVRTKFEELETAVNSEVLERREEIFCAILALVGASTMFTLGKPGIAKSMLPNRIMKRVTGARYYSTLLGRTTPPEEIFGPPSLQGLKEGRFEHEIEGYLPTADVAEFDEIWKCSSACLNSLLWGINERKYRHGKTVIRIPLTTVFAQSNELPEDSSLAALYDRFIFRFISEPLQDNDSFAEMLRLTWPEDPDPILSWEEILFAQRQAALIPISDAVVEAFIEMRKQLRAENIEPSDRRFVQALKIVRAAAWMDDCNLADIDHLAPLAHVFWRDEGERARVSNIVLAKANPLEREVDELVLDLRSVIGEIDAISSSEDRMLVSGEIYGKLKKAEGELERLLVRAGEGHRRKLKVNQATKLLNTLITRTQAEVLNLPPETKKK